MSSAGWQRELSRNKKVEAALQNEFLTRERVMKLTSVIASQDGRINALESSWAMFSRRGFLGRLKWLVTGQ